jgi:hypothetical protein
MNRLGNHANPMSQTYFWTMMQFSSTTVPSFKQLELFSHGLKNKVNFNIFAGQQKHRIWTSVNHSGQFWRLEWRTDSHLQHQHQLENVLREEWYKIPLQTVQNSYESIARRIAAVLKAKCGPTPY